jgi:tetratricopeptide (TPR) repeat protein
MNITNRFTEADKLFGNALRLLASGDVAAAAELLASVTEKFPSHGKSWNELGNIFQYELHDPDSAEECYKKAMEVTPGLPEAYLGYADVLFSKQRFAEVNAMLNKVMEIPGVRKDIALYKAGLLQESQGRYDEAIETFRDAIMVSFSDEEIILCEKAINRCNTKKKYR